MGIFDGFYSNLIVIINYLNSDLVKKQRAFKIGLVSIFMVVFFLTLLLNAIQLCPSIFIKLGEEQSGEIDLIFTPYLLSQNVENKKSGFDKFFYNKTKTPDSNSTSNFSLGNLNFLNFYEIRDRLSYLPFIEGVSPRWIITGKTTKRSKEQNITSEFSTNVFILDSASENNIGIGRELNLPELKKNECYVSTTLGDALRLNNGDQIEIAIRISDLMKAFRAGEDSQEEKEDDSKDKPQPQPNSNSNSNYNTNEKRRLKSEEYFESMGDYDYLDLDYIKNLLESLSKNNNFNDYLLRLINLVKNYPDKEKLKDLFLSIIKNSDFIKNEYKDILNSLFKGNVNLIKVYKKLSQIPTFDNITQFLNFKLNLTVREKVKATGGKWPSASGNVLAMDSRHILDYLSINAERIVDEIVKSFDISYLKPIIMNYVQNFLKDFDINNYALTVNAIFKDKFEIYSKTQKEMRHYISDIAGEITDMLGIDYKVNIETPLYQIMAGLEYPKIFLQDIFIGIMFFLWMLCVLLVYSLMLGNVDERTYEFGMMRSLGFKKNNLIFLIIIQGFIFAVPGVVLGLTTSYIANNFVAYLFNYNSALVMPFFLSKSNIIFGVVAGLSIPLISSYFPIKKSLEDNLKETLTIFNKKIGDIVVSIIKLENLGVSPTTFIASITLIVIGLLTYYVAPLSFLLMNVSLFLFIMIGILLTMLLGLIILTQLLVPHLQKFILKIIMLLSFKDRKLELIVLKNLEGHKRRDQQVSIMFMVALGFVIFAGCTLNLVVDFVETMAKSLIGGDFSVLVLENGQNITLNEISINKYLNNIKISYPDIIQNHAYISYSSNELFQSNGYSLSSRIGALNGYPISNRKVIAIDKNFIDSTYTSLYTVTQYNKKLNVSKTLDGKADIIKMMYDNPNVPYILQGKSNSFIYPESNNSRISNILGNFQLNMIAAEGISKAQAINIDSPARLRLSQHSIPCQIVGMASKLPGILTYSSYNTISRRSEVYISMDQMKQLMDKESEIYHFQIANNSNSTVDGVRKKQFTLKYKEGISKEYREMIYFAMNNYLEGLNTFSLQLDDVIDISEKVKKVIGYIFIVLGIIALILSFFLIWISFNSNIRENIAEYGIMRSIGVTKAQSIRIYLYEAATIILTSIVIGTFIGIVISSSLILQFDIFLELPFVFNFPYALYFILITVGLFLGLLGSYYPTYAVNTLSLVKIMKGFSE